MPRKPGGRWLLYVAPDESRPRVEGELRGVLDAAAMRQIEIRTLPRDLLSIREHGLLYLPRPYVVPGGRFNEMYGWDSYFIQVGLLRDGPRLHFIDNLDPDSYALLLARALPGGAEAFRERRSSLSPWERDGERGSDSSCQDLEHASARRQARWRSPSPQPSPGGRGSQKVRFSP